MSRSTSAPRFDELEQARRDVRLARQRPISRTSSKPNPLGQRSAHFDRFLLRVHFDDVEAADQFLGLGERSVDDAALALLHRDARHFAAGFRPSAATSTPALCISSLNLM